MSEHLSIERMNESLDGLLSAAATDEIERHVTECALCRNEYARLSETLTAVSRLPREAAPPEDVWDRIAARIGDRPDTADEEVPVYRLPTARRSARRLSFSVGEAIAAGIAVALLSAGLMWVAIGGGGRAGAATASVAGAAPGGAAARAVSLEDSRYAEVSMRLEQILEEGRGVLTAETLVSIEESLATIDAAIEEIETALASDPNSDLLKRMLANQQQTRLGVLERAAAAVQAQT